MRSLLYLFAAFLILVTLYGCAASGEKYTTLTELGNIDENLFLYREGRFFGTAIQPTVYVDGEYLGSLESAGFIKHTITAGEHTLRIGNKETSFAIKNGEKHYYKYNVRVSLLFFITLIDEDLSKVDAKTAKNELAETSLSTHRINNNVNIKSPNQTDTKNASPD